MSPPSTLESGTLPQPKGAVVRARLCRVPLAGNGRSLGVHEELITLSSSHGFIRIGAARERPRISSTPSSVTVALTPDGSEITRSR